MSERAGRARIAHAIWTTEGFPVNNDTQDDAGARPVQTTLPGGTIFRVIEFKPGVQARNHRTDSIDYIVCMAGEIDMEMDGTMVHLKAGDVMVQRGTIHNWINNGKESCIIAVILIDAKPVTAENGKVLNAVGETLAAVIPGRARKRASPESRTTGRGYGS